GTRLSPPQGQATQLTLIGGSLSGTLETILDRAMDFLRAKPGLFHERPLTALLDNEEVARTISPSGAWRAKLTALVSHMETNQAAYGAHVVSKVKQSANTFLGHAER